MENKKALKLTQEYPIIEFAGKEYQLAFDAIAADKANTELNSADPAPSTPVNVANPTHWFSLNCSQLAVVVWACLDLFHPDVELSNVKRWVGPGSYDAVFSLLFGHTWPDVFNRLNTAMNKGSSAGETTPNT
jgi:hypothetical protein